MRLAKRPKSVGLMASTGSGVTDAGRQAEENIMWQDQHPSPLPLHPRQQAACSPLPPDPEAHGICSPLPPDPEVHGICSPLPPDPPTRWPLGRRAAAGLA